jgi:NADH-quinone oxidoreductase subunit N
MLAAAANDLVLLFVSLELVSIPTYILLYLGRRGVASQESAAKYFFLSILASGMLLYGFCFLYGTTGSTDFSQIRTVLSTPNSVPVPFIHFFLLGLVLMFAGLSFKIAAVPFHFYAPDVYQGTTHGNAALLSVMPKAAGMVVLVRLLVDTMPGSHDFAWQVALALAVLTMTFGNVVALWQDNVRRLLAYSSIAHAGYMLIGLAVGLATVGSPMKWDGIGALLFYLLVYAIATIGTFAALDYLGRKETQLDTIDELAGLGRTRPAIAALLGVFMFSLAGIPPLAGFWGKLTIFAGALDVTDMELRPWFITLAVIGVLNAAIAAAYYLRIVATMYFRTPLGTPAAQGGRGPYLAAVACAVLVIAIGLFPQRPIGAANQASPTAPPALEVQAAALTHTSPP